MHATTLLPTALLALPALASTPPQPSLTTTIIPRTTTSAPTTITNTHTLLPRTDGPIVTDGTGHWQPPFDIGGMTTHPLPHPSPPLKTLLTPNCSSPEYCLWYPSGVPDDDDYPSLRLETRLTTHRSRDAETVFVGWDTVTKGRGIVFRPIRTAGVRFEWRVKDGVVEQRAVWEGGLREAVEEWGRRSEVTNIRDAVETWRERDRGGDGWGTRPVATRLSEVVERWRERGRQPKWTDLAGIGGTVFEGMTVVGGTAVGGMEVVGGTLFIEGTKIVGGTTLGRRAVETGVSSTAKMMKMEGLGGTTLVRVVRRVVETVRSPTAKMTKLKRLGRRRDGVGSSTVVTGKAEEPSPTRMTETEMTVDDNETKKGRTACSKDTGRFARDAFERQSSGRGLSSIWLAGHASPSAYSTAR